MMVAMNVFRAPGFVERVMAHGMSEEKAVRMRVRMLIRQVAHAKVAKELKEGRMVRPDHCSRCDARGRHAPGRWVGAQRVSGTTVIHAHHPDYAEPLKVVWLCHLCHRREHAGRRAS